MSVQSSLMTDLLLLGPEVMLAVGGLIMLVVGAFAKTPEQAFGRVFWVMLGLVILSISSLSHAGIESYDLLGGFLQLNSFTVVVKVILLALMGFSLMILRPFCIQERFMPFEMPLLYCFAALGMMIMVGAADLLTLYVGMELQAFSFYILTAIRRDDKLSSEAALKYFTLGALASGVLLLGIALLYGATGTTRYEAFEIALRLNHDATSIGLIAGMVFLLSGFAFKLAAAPFHPWAPDVYTGAQTPVTALFAIVPKLAVVAALATLLYGPLAPLFEQWQQLIVIFAVLSVVVGAFAALKQTQIKRLLAYGAVGHAGYILIAIAGGTTQGVAAALLYLVLYGVASIGIFSLLTGLRTKGKLDDRFERFAGLSKTHPWVALCLSIFLLSMAGIPPFGGFFAKLLVFQAAVDAGLIPLAIVGVLAAVVSAFYYIRIVKIIYFDPETEKFDMPMMPTLHYFTIISAVILVFYILFPESLWTLAQAATLPLSFR